jgi:hypothetical protein
LRSPVYRHLDQPFEILGFNPLELIVLSITLVGGSELAQDLAFPRPYAVLLTLFLALSLFGLRRALGPLFLRRLRRFSHLPTETYPQLWTQRKGPQNVAIN